MFETAAGPRLLFSKVCSSACLKASGDTVHTLPGDPSANTPCSNWLPAGVFSST
jgi:hypothetical protein